MIVFEATVAVLCNSPPGPILHPPSDTSGRLPTAGPRNSSPPRHRPHIRGTFVSISQSVMTELQMEVRPSLLRYCTHFSVCCRGGFHFFSRGLSDECVDPEINCPLAAISGTVFLKNKAEVAGGAIFSTSLKAVRVRCSVGSDEYIHEFYDQKKWESMNTADSLDAVCPTWKGNKAGLYGPAIASYATQVKKTIIYEDGVGKVELSGDRYVISEQRSGIPLPIIVLEVLDDFGQGPAVATTSSTINASMSSADGYIYGVISVPLLDGVGNFSGVTGFGSAGSHNLSIEFSQTSLHSFLIVVEVRGCMIGETMTSNGAFCEPCNSDTFNFLPGRKSACRSCPTNGDCATHVILPKTGYWNPTPCSDRIQRCIVSKACGSPNRRATMAEMTKNVEQCEFEVEYTNKYTETQCKEGHVGPLCGSCKPSYVQSQSLMCKTCLSTFGDAAMLMVGVLVLSCLTSFTVRGNHTPTSAQVVRGPDRRNAGTTSHSSSSQPITINEQMVEMLVTGHVPPEVMYPSQCRGTSQEQLVKQTELAKWKAVEMFKITVNFLQVTAIALFINTDWIPALISFFQAQEIISGVTSELVIHSVECLVPETFSVERSIIGVVINALVPLFVVCLFAPFWIALKTKKKESSKYMIKKIVLSTFAVCYITYISVTKTLVSILNCVKVHDSLDIYSDSTTVYWAVDTSIECYRGSHAVLVGVLALPSLVLFSLGFPMVVACLAVKQVKADYEDRWICEVAGFMYRSYGGNFHYWESVIMFRKAILALIVVQSYSMGGSLQAGLAAFVLALALYFQAICRPFRQEFETLNDLESVSVLVSLLTFLSSLFFIDSRRVSHEVRLFIAIGIWFSNCGLFLYFVTFFISFSAEYFRSKLETEGIHCEPDLGTMDILKVYFIDHVTRKTRKKIYSFVRFVIDRPHQNPNP